MVAHDLGRRFHNYRLIARRYAGLAEALHVDLLTIGTGACDYIVCGSDYGGRVYICCSDLVAVYAYAYEVPLGPHRQAL